MKSKAWTEKVMQGVFFIAACTSVLAVALICIFLFANGIPAIRQIGFVKFITGDIWRPGNELFWYFSDDHRKYLCDGRSNYIWCADRNSDFGIYGYVLPEENLQTVKSSN